MLQGGTAVAIVEIDDIAWKTQQSTNEERRLWMGNAAQFIRQFTQDHNMGMVIATYDNHFVVPGSVQEPYFSSLLEQLIRAFYAHFASSITIGTGMYTTAFDKLHDSYRQAQAALSIKWISVKTG